MNDNTKQRYYYWDNIKGFLIILVVFAHFLLVLRNNDFINAVFTAIYLFHMPAFVFVSGFFGKSENSGSPRSILTLFVMFLLLNGFFMLYKSAVLHEGISPFVTYNSAWYLWALIVWRLFTPALAKIRFIVPLSILVSLLSIFAPGINLTLGLIKIFAFFPFYLAGYLFTADNFLAISKMKPGRKNVCAISGIIFTVIAGCLTMRFCNLQNPDIIPNYYEHPSLSNAGARFMIYLTSAFAIFALLFASREKQIPLLSKFGRNSLFIYVIHRPITLFTGGLQLFMPGFSQFAAAILFTFAVCLFAGSDSASSGFKNFVDKFTKIITTEKT